MGVAGWRWCVGWICISGITEAHYDPHRLERPPLPHVVVDWPLQPPVPTASGDDVNTISPCEAPDEGGQECSEFRARGRDASQTT
jgi:hypothetical protein